MILLKKFLFSFLFLMFFSTSFVNAEGVYVNNKKLDGATPIVLKDGRTYMAVSDMSKILGGVLSWDNATKTATITTDDMTLSFTDGSNIMALNGSKIHLDFKSFFHNNKLVAPATILRDFLNFTISWEHNSKNFLINPSEDTNSKLIDNIEFSSSRDLPKIEKAVANDNLRFKYAFIYDVKNEKYLPDGKYFTFKANEKGNIQKFTEGYFYMNVYTDDVYYYPIYLSDSEEDIKKYKNGKEIDNFVKNGKDTVHTLIATTHMINEIMKSDNALSGFKYVNKDDITSDYLSRIPKSTYYYYEANKDDNGTLTPQFQIAQDASTLDVYLFLKKENGVNVIKLTNDSEKNIEFVVKK